MYFLEMLCGFFSLFGMALFMRKLFRLNVGEGFFLAAATVSLLLWGSSVIFGTFLYGFYMILGLAGAGILCGVVDIIRGKKRALAVLFSPASVLLLGLFLFSLVAFFHDYIQHIDEFHFWAAAVKYMLENDAMPTGSDFLGGSGQYAFATSLFHLFFQKFCGYNEQSMYVSAFLLMWIGFLLPFSRYSWKNWKKPVIYIVIIYIALFSLYAYGVKSLYVDVPVAAWAGGLAGWWMNRKKKRSNLLVTGSGFLMLHFSKASAGLLMAVLVGLFMLVYSVVIEKGRLEKKNCIKKLTVFTGILCLLVVLGSCLLIWAAASITPYESEQTADAVEQEPTSDGTTQWALGGIKLPESVSNQINVVKLTKEKIKLTTGRFLTYSVGKPMSSRSSLKLAFVPFLAMVIFLLKISGDLYQQKDEHRVYILYCLLAGVIFSAVLLLSFLFMFTYQLSVEMRGCARYFSLYAIYAFVLALTRLLQKKDSEKGKVQSYALFGVAIFFLLGVNVKFIPNMTALDKKNSVGYSKIKTTVDEVNQLEEILSETDKVYYLCQYSASNLGGAELYNASALYYMDGQISNYLQSPWKFTSKGCNIQLESFEMTIGALPTLLAQGGYTYLWVYKTDSYLTEMLPQVLLCDTAADDGYLYKVIYEDGTATGLEFVKVLGK